MRGIKILFGTTALLAGLALAPAAQAQIFCSALVCSRFVNMATTTTRPTPARPMAITGQGTSTTASSWAWARGPVGDTATAGAAIGSVRMAAATITAAAAGRPIAAIMHVAEAAQAGRVPALVAVKRSAPVLRGRTRPQLPVQLLRTRSAPSGGGGGHQGGGGGGGHQAGGGGGGHQGGGGGGGHEGGGH